MRKTPNKLEIEAKIWEIIEKTKEGVIISEKSKSAIGG